MRISGLNTDRKERRQYEGPRHGPKTASFVTYQHDKFFSKINRYYTRISSSLFKPKVF